MAVSSGGGGSSANPYGNPSSAADAPTYTPPAPATDPSSYTYTPPTVSATPPVPAAVVGGTPSYSSGTPNTAGSYVQGQTSPPGGTPPPAAPAAGFSPSDWSNLLNPSWVGSQSQQWLDFMTGSQGVQFQNQLAQQQQDLQKQIQTAAYTGDWNGVQTLQAQLQDTQIQLAKNQADMNNAIGFGNLTGQYNGQATLQAQDVMNNMALSARGQDVTMAGIQAQLAQSPLVAWYTARGLPPPQSAIMTGPAAWNPTWDFSKQVGPDPLLGSDPVPLPPGVTPAA